ncbi:MAG: adenine deaminase [Desulfobacteraceae bacterium]|nr:adenine deaminase [Desulfobacteraceae bacterium]MBC2752083.1 adenine deaminase [Desulfobacteraceae bacterium]
MTMEHLIAVARGDQPADLLLRNGKVVNVFSGEIMEMDIAVAAGHVAGFGPRSALSEVDLQGRCVAPGFIDAHVHIESAMASPTEFARAVLPHGTTTVVADPHEIANVLGLAGIEYMLQSTASLPMQFFFTLSSCVPATSMETAGAALTAEALAPLMPHPRVVALAEMMNFPGVIQGDPSVMAKIRLARDARKRVDGHAPGVQGPSLDAYIAAGVASDHECITAAEAMEKLRRGMHIMIREGTGAKNMAALLDIIQPATAHRLMWCTDDRHPHDILAEGHIDAMVRQAIQLGVAPHLAIRLATLNPAAYFGLPRTGAIAPGQRADMVVFNRLDNPVAEAVYAGGQQVAEHGRLLETAVFPDPIPPAPAMHVDPTALDFRVTAASPHIRVIEIVPGQIVTRQGQEATPVADGRAVADPDRDLLKIAVVERHRGTGRTGIGFVKGMGLRRGAIASSVAHDAHNIIVVGARDDDMHAAVRHVVAMQGGLAVVADGKVLASLALPIAGLMSPEPIRSIQDQLTGLTRAARDLGTSLADPFMTLSFLALPVIPELKITDRGLVDVDRFEPVDLFLQ